MNNTTDTAVKSMGFDDFIITSGFFMYIFYIIIIIPLYSLFNGIIEKCNKVK